MKKVVSFLLILLAAATVVFAQPQKMTYQMVVRNSNNELVVNQTIGVKVSIFQDTINGLPAYAETHTAMTNANALMTIQIGTGTPFVLNNYLSDVKWKDHRNFIKVEIDPTGGTSYTIVGTQELVSVPYAFYAESSKYVDTALCAYKSDSSLFANMANIANYADSTRISYSSKYSDTTLYSYKSDNSVYANTADTSNTANYADSARVANIANSANTANTASSALTANYADTTRISNVSNTSNTAISAIYADTAFFLMNAQNSDTAKFAYHSDTANYALNSGSANYANTANTSNYADSTRISYFSKYSDTTLYSYKTDTSVYANIALTSNVANYADSARVANTANSANTANTASSALTANYADSTRISNSANSANIAHYADTTRISNVSNTANTAISATYADTADYNKLLNKPAGINHGDILYWESSDSSWHIVPVGNIGETLTLDSNKTPHWTQNSTQSVALPTIITDTIINITTNSAMAKGSVTADGGSPFVFSGICWDTTHNPTTADFHTLDGIGIGSISSNLLGLAMGQYYYVRAFATNSAGTAYGNELVFRTQTYPAVTTNAISNISVTTALSGGDVTDDGGAPIIAHGVCWSSTSTAPTIADGHTSDGAGIGTYSSVLTPLMPNTKYYARAYATNYIGTSYGDTVSFTTFGAPPMVTTTAVNGITNNSAVLGGDVTNDGNVTVIERGVCWNTTGNPTMADNFIAIGSGSGSFSNTITGLTSLTTYYVRAYAINAIDTSYGMDEIFTTLWFCGDTISDCEHNVYNTLLLGTQCWMKENLRTTHYADGVVLTYGNMSSSTETAYVYYPNNDSSNITIYGCLYNWIAVTKGVTSDINPSGVQGICPNGWHVPSDAEWTQLTDFVSSQSQYWCGGTSTYIAKSLASTIGWVSTSTTTCCIGNDISVNNATGFSVVPSGSFNGSYSSFGENVQYWTATEYSTNNAYDRRFREYAAEVVVSNFGKYVGRSVRCLKD